MNNRVAFTGFNNVTVTNFKVGYNNKDCKNYARLCLQLNDNEGKDLSENANLLKRFPDKMRSNYLRIDSTVDGFALNGKPLEFYGDNGSLFGQVAKLLTKVKENSYHITYSEKYLKSTQLIENMVCCVPGLKYKKSDLAPLKKAVFASPEIVIDRKKIVSFAQEVAEVCHDFSKYSKLLS